MMSRKSALLLAVLVIGCVIAPSSAFRLKKGARTPHTKDLVPAGLLWGMTEVPSADTKLDIPAPPTFNTTGNVTQFTINLDEPAETRWNAVVDQYKNEMQALIAFFPFPKSLQPFIDLIASDLDKYMGNYGQEIKGVADRIGWNVGLGVVLNLLYELTAYCTSIVASDSTGKIMHGRNLDYGLAEALRKVTVEVQFTRNGTVVYEGTTFAGYVGLLTGMRQGKVSVSVDERDTKDGKLWENAIEAIFHHNARPISFELRDILDQGLDFQTALATVTKTPTIAPVYVIIGGVNYPEGAVVTRERARAENVWTMAASNPTPVGKWFLVETNDDHWLPPKDKRRDTAIAAMEKLGQANVNKDGLIEVLLTEPVCNSGTIYNTIMSAAYGNYATMLRDCQ